MLVNKYLGDISSIDGAGSVLGMEFRRALAEDFRSASVGRNPALRFSLPAKVAEALQASPEFIGLTEQIDRISQQIETPL